MQKVVSTNYIMISQLTFDGLNIQIQMLVITYFEPDTVSTTDPPTALAVSGDVVKASNSA